MKILIIEDHPKIRENIKKFLKISWYLAEIAINWKDWLDKVIYWDYDLIILDVNMPVMNWKEFMINMRKLSKNIPVIALTSNSLLDDKIEMFDLWVLDYMTKPFEFRELEARIKSLLKRKETIVDDILIIWDIKIDFSKHKVYKTPLAFSKLPPQMRGTEGEYQVELSTKEYLIIEFLSRNKSYPKTKLEILEHVWWEAEENLELSSTTMEAHISMIRRKLWIEFIKNIRWIGYIIE